MVQVFKNNAWATLAAPLAANQTSLSLVSGLAANFPALNNNDFFLATLVGLNANGNEDEWEVVKCTAKSGDTLTIVRAQEGTAARDWPTGTLIEMRVTAGTLGSFTTVDQAKSAAPVQSVFGRSGNVSLTKNDVTKALGFTPLESVPAPDLNWCAPKESPVFTGRPTAPIPDVNSNSNRIATTAMVHEVMNAWRHQARSSIGHSYDLLALETGTDDWHSILTVSLGRPMSSTLATTASCTFRLDGTKTPDFSSIPFGLRLRIYSADHAMVAHSVPARVDIDFHTSFVWAYPLSIAYTYGWLPQDKDYSVSLDVYCSRQYAGTPPRVGGREICATWV